MSSSTELGIVRAHNLKSDAEGIDPEERDDGAYQALVEITSLPECKTQPVEKLLALLGGA